MLMALDMKFKEPGELSGRLHNKLPKMFGFDFHIFISPDDFHLEIFDS